MLQQVVDTTHREKFETNIVQIICKLEMIFLLSFFDSMEHLPIYLPFEVKVGGLVQYKWVYLFEMLGITHTS
jgi:hypothetical protein